MVLDEVRDDLRVRLARELVPLGAERLAEGLVVLDDAVVHERDPPRAIRVGVGIGIRRRAVSAPAGVADADLARREPTVEVLFELGDIALPFVDHEAVSAADRDARGVVPPVLQVL